MAGYPYVSQVTDAATRKALIAAFDLIATLRTELTTLKAQLAALQPPPPTP